MEVEDLVTLQGLFSSLESVCRGGGEETLLLSGSWTEFRSTNKIGKTGCYSFPPVVCRSMGVGICHQNWRKVGWLMVLLIVLRSGSLKRRVWMQWWTGGSVSEQEALWTGSLCWGSAPKTGSGCDEEMVFRGLLAFSAVRASWVYVLGSVKSCFKSRMFLLRF